MNTDEVKVHTPDESKKEIKNKKSASRDLVKKLYIEENKNYEEISEELGLSLGTVKLYITQGGYNKNPRRKRKNKTPKDQNTSEETNPVNENTENDERPYMDLGSGYVVYKGRLMKKMTKEEFIQAMLDDQNKRKLNN